MLPVFHLNEIVRHCFVDTQFVPFLKGRKWHLTNLKVKAAPRTSFTAQSGKTKHLSLNRVVVVLNELDPQQVLDVWRDVENLYERCRNLPRLSFVLNDPFDCRLSNICVSQGKVPVLESKNLDRPKPSPEVLMSYGDEGETGQNPLMRDGNPTSQRAGQETKAGHIGQEAKAFPIITPDNEFDPEVNKDLPTTDKGAKGLFTELFGEY